MKDLSPLFSYEVVNSWVHLLLHHAEHAPRCPRSHPLGRGQRCRRRPRRHPSARRRGPPAVVDPTALVAAAVAATPAAAPAPTAPPNAATDLPALPETPMVLPVSSVIPPAVPAPAATESAPPAVSTVIPPTPAPSPDPVPQAAPPDTPAPAPAAQATPVTGVSAEAGDTGNTAADNSNDITISSQADSPQVFIWNWFWNCAADEAVPAVASPPANATVIVLNWHWGCAEQPPPLDVAGVTVCVSCNVAISVRVASPGNTGDLTQSIAAKTAAAATDIADTIEHALQSAPAPAPSAPPAPTPVPTPPAATAPAQLSQAESVANSVVYRVDAELPASVGAAAPEDLPRVGLPQISAYAFLSAARSKVPRNAAGTAPARSRIPAAGRAAALVRVVVIERWIDRHDAARTTSSPAVPEARPVAASRRSPVPTAPLLPSLPVPVLAGAGVASAQGGGPGAIAALACGLALLFAYAIFTALRLPPAVPPAGARTRTRIRRGEARLSTNRCDHSTQQSSRQETNDAQATSPARAGDDRRPHGGLRLSGRSGPIQVSGQSATPRSRPLPGRARRRSTRATPTSQSAS